MNPVVFKLQHNDWINNYLGIGDFKSSFSRVSCGHKVVALQYKQGKIFAAQKFIRYV